MNKGILMSISFFEKCFLYIQTLILISMNITNPLKNTKIKGKDTDNQNIIEGLLSDNPLWM